MEKSHEEFFLAESVLQNVVSYMAIIISLVLLASTIIVFCLLRGSQTNSNTIHLCLVFTIFTAELIFLIALKSRHSLVYHQFPCKIIAILLHFLFLSIFSWLLVEAIHIFRMMTNLCDINHGPMHSYFFIGFGGPALIVGLSVGMSIDQYGNHFFCWLSVHENVVWSLVGPICCIVVVILSVFLSALKSSLKCKNSITNFGNLKTLLWLAIMLLPIQGSTWVLAILSVNETHSILQYAFAFFCLLEGIYIFIGYCVINRKVQQQVRLMWLRVIKNEKYPEINGIKSCSNSTIYQPSTKVYHRSIGISTSSDTSRSTAKTCSRVESDPKDNQPSTSHFECYKEVCCKHGKINHPILKNNDFEKYSDSASSGPKMGVNVFSYPRLPGSRSPLSITSLSLKMGLNSKDPSLSWGSVYSQKSSPLSAPGCTSRPELGAPRMGIRGVEKSNISGRDVVAETNSFDSTFHLTSPSLKPEFIKAGICSFCRSQSFSKDAFSNLSNAEFSQYETYMKQMCKSNPQVYKKNVLTSKETLLSFNRKLSQNMKSLQSNENMKSILKEKLLFKSMPKDFTDDTNVSLRKNASNNELRRSIVNASPVKENVRNVFNNSVPQSEVSPVCTPDTESYLDRASPRLIDDTPSDEEVPTSINVNGRNSQSNFFSISYFQKPSNFPYLLEKAIPPLATAESDSDGEL